MKLIALLENTTPDAAQRRRYSLEFQQELAELSETWTAETALIGMGAVPGLKVTNGKATVELMTMVMGGGKYQMINYHLMLLHNNVYYETAQDFLDYAYEYFK